MVLPDAGSGRSNEMIDATYRPLAELKELHREEQRLELKRAYAEKKAAKRLDKISKLAKLAAHKINRAGSN
jgi:hypothetical protein